MAACFSVVASELIRRGVVGGTGPGVVSVLLDAVANPVNRSRQAARYRVRVQIDGAPVPWAAGVWLVDSRGYLLAWSYQDVGKWLVKSLSGAPVVVNLRVSDAAGLPAKWTASRLAALGGKVAALSVPGVLADAADKLATVTSWAASERRAAVEAAAQNMRQAAAILQGVQAMQAGGAWAAVDLGTDDQAAADAAAAAAAQAAAAAAAAAQAAADAAAAAAAQAVADAAAAAAAAQAAADAAAAAAAQAVADAALAQLGIIRVSQGIQEDAARAGAADAANLLAAALAAKLVPDAAAAEAASGAAGAAVARAGAAALASDNYLALAVVQAGICTGSNREAAAAALLAEIRALSVSAHVVAADAQADADLAAQAAADAVVLQAAADAAAAAAAAAAQAAADALALQAAADAAGALLVVDVLGVGGAPLPLTFDGAGAVQWVPVDLVAGRSYVFDLTL